VSLAWETDHALAAAHPDAVGQDIAQLLTMNDMFRPGLAEARAQLGGWRQSLLDLFGQVELLVLPTMPVFPPGLEDLTPGSLVDIVIQVSQYTGLFNAAGCRARPSRYGPRAHVSRRARNSSARSVARNCCSPPRSGIEAAMA